MVIMTAAEKDKPTEKPLTSVMEDYLEAIFDLDKEKRVVRVKDIAKRLDVKMPTVTSMLKTLNDRNMVNYEKYEYVELTDDGAAVGREMRRRHEALLDFLIEILSVDPKTADEEACKMEHALSEDSLNRLIDFMDFIRACPRTGENWLSHFQDYRKHGHDPKKCVQHSETFSCEYNKRVSPKRQSGKKNK